MHSSRFARHTISASAIAAIAILATSASAQEAFVKDDIAYGLSVGAPNFTAAQTLRQVHANLGVADSANFTTTAWGETFIQIVQFDNLNGFRHNSAGNLLGLNFGVSPTSTSTNYGKLVSFGTRGGASNPVASQTLITFDGTPAGGSGLARTRVGGISVNPSNSRIGLTAYDAGGQFVWYNYTAGDSNGAGAAATFAGSVTIPNIAGKTTNTTWLDENTALLVGQGSDGLTTDQLLKVTINPADNTATVTDFVAGVFAGNTFTFTNVNYEPTVSPYIYVSGSAFISNQTVNLISIVDPETASVVKTVNVSTASNTLRATSLDSKGNLLLGAFGGSSALDTQYTLLSMVNAKDPNAVSDNTLLGIGTRGQTGVSASFTGNDIAITNVDYVNADVLVTIGAAGDVTQSYYGTSPADKVVAKLAAGKIVSGGALAVGYAFTDGAGSGTFRLLATLKGDTDLNKAVNFDDLLTLAQNYNTATGATWSLGDSTYDGAVNFDDLLALAQNYGTSALADGSMLTSLGYADVSADWTLALSIAVPEPTSLAALSLAGLCLSRRRR